MDINRYNYEEYFLLYTDNELNTSDRAVVEEFISANPDLGEELLILQQYIMVPDEVVFPDKAALLKTADNHFIHAGNYEERFLLYADNELNGHERESVEQYVYNHPELQSAFELICQTISRPDNSVLFPDKESLLRYEFEKVPVITWWKLAAAAMVVLVAGALWLNNQPLAVNQRPVAELKNSNTPEQEKTSGRKTAAKSDSIISQPLNHPTYPTDPATAVAAVEYKEPKSGRRKQNTTEEVKSTARITGNVRRVQSQVKNAVRQTNAANNTAFNSISSSVIDNQKSVIDEPVAASTISESDIADSGVSFASSNDTEDIYISNIPLDKKHALRGLFRKASRMINKATGINTGEKGILISGLELALK